MAALCETLGIEGLGWHAFRHWSATTLLATTDVATVAARLGHSTPTTTLHYYAHAMEQRSQAAADALGAALDHAADTPRRSPR